MNQTKSPKKVELQNSHTGCSILDNNTATNTAHDLIWALVLKYIMDCHYKNTQATNKDALSPTLSEIGFFIKSRPIHPISTYLKQCILLFK